MANPQLEDGYTRISNSILEAFARIRIPGEARQVLDTIVRLTYGWNKKEDEISLEQFVRKTGIHDKAHICRAIEKLRDMNLIIVSKPKTPLPKKTKQSPNYGINKDFDTWRPLPKKARLPKKAKGLCRKRQKPLPKRTTNNAVSANKIYKLQRSKEKNKIKNNKEIDRRFEVFWESYPKKVGKKAAWQKWHRLKPSEKLLQTLLEAIREQKAWRDNAGPGEFRPEWPNPLTWLNQARWEDELSIMNSEKKSKPIMVKCECCGAMIKKNAIVCSNCKSQRNVPPKSRPEDLRSEIDCAVEGAVKNLRREKQRKNESEFFG